MQVNLVFEWLSNGELLTPKTGPPCRYATNVIASASFGINVDSLGDPDNEFYRMGKKVSSINGLVAASKVIGFLWCPWLLKVKTPYESLISVAMNQY